MTRHLSHAERKAIAGQARTLHERLDGPPNDPGNDPAIDPDELLAEWVDLFPSEEEFTDRLERGGLTESDVYEQLSATQWPSDTPMPDWINDLESLIHHVKRSKPNDQRSLSAPHEIPFVELLTVIVDYARTQLSIPPDGVTRMEKWLLTRLNRICVRALYVEFKSFVEYHDPALAATDPDDVSDPGTVYYDQFIESMFDDGFRKLCIEYPVLARFIVRAIDQWVTTVATICRRIRADRDVLTDRFAIDGEVTAIDPLADDVHAGGQVPVRVSFESGSVIYKPRSIDAGIALYTVLDRLDSHHSIPNSTAPTFLSREGYGWMEPIEYRDVSDEAAVDRYYERVGMLLCVAYVLDLPDCQFENLIVSGEQPMIVDAETVFHPHLQPAANSYTTEVDAAMTDSVLRTALLPWTIGDIDDQDTDLQNPLLAAGIGSSSETMEVSAVTKPTVKAVNTDVMKIKKRSPTVDRTTNTLSMGGTDQPPDEHIETIVDGFQRTYTVIRDLHEDGRFCSEIIDRSLVAGVENRLVFRSTEIYYSILRLSVARAPLRDGARLSVEFERLAVPFFNDRIESDRFWGLYAAERRSLRQRDVPRFTSRPGETKLSHDGTPTGLEADIAGYERCKQRLDSMGNTDLRKQTWLIRRSIDSSLPARETPPAPVRLTDERLRDEAIKYGDWAIDAAIETSVGRKWVSLIGEKLSQICVSPADNTLYDGRGGIGLTAAALYDRTGHDRFREVAIEALDLVADDQGESPTPFGGIKGLGSIVYTLSVAAELLDRPVYRQRGAEYARSVSTEQLAEDEPFDLIDGTAGMVLALLAHYERYGGPEIRDRAVACGEQLLDGRVSVDGYRVWVGDSEAQRASNSSEPIPGIAHGVSGIGYALARLAAVVDEDRYAAAAREALAYESTLYDAGRSNYRIPTESEDYLDQWCHGRTSCALARIGIGTQLEDDELITEANELLSQTAGAECTLYDQLCCGNLGRAIALLEAARYTDRDSTDARAIAGRCLAREEETGALAMLGHGETVHNPTFFHGVSGVAYTMLRLAEPEELPCVLLLE